MVVRTSLESREHRHVDTLLAPENTTELPRPTPKANGSPTSSTQFSSFFPFKVPKIRGYNGESQDFLTHPLMGCRPKIASWPHATTNEAALMSGSFSVYLKKIMPARGPGRQLLPDDLWRLKLAPELPVSYAHDYMYIYIYTLCIYVYIYVCVTLYCTW